MNKQFSKFLKNKPERKDPNECDHDESQWCAKCVNFGTYVDLREQGLGHGHIHISGLKD